MPLLVHECEFDTVFDGVADGAPAVGENDRVLCVALCDPLRVDKDVDLDSVAADAVRDAEAL